MSNHDADQVQVSFHARRRMAEFGFLENRVRDVIRSADRTWQGLDSGASNTSVPP